MFPKTITFCSTAYTQQPGLVIPYAPACETFIYELRQLPYTTVLDLGCGSGILGLSLGRAQDVTLVDISPDACALARINGGVNVLCGSWFEPCSGTYSLIIANPPHGTSAEYLESSWASQYVPRVSVDGGVNGMDHIEHIIAHASPYMSGYLAIIHDIPMTDTVAHLAVQAGLVVKSVSHSGEMAMSVLVK